MSSSIPILPINDVSYAADRAITNAQDVLTHLDTFNKFKKIPNQSCHYCLREEHEDYMYGTDSIVSSVTGIRQYKFGIGPLEMSISYEPDEQAVILQLYFGLPILGSVLVGGVTGSVETGITLNAKFSSHLTGDVGIKLNGKHVLLFFDFTAFGHAWHEPGHVLFDI
ncbi:hypothetical protein BDP27DRAFT_1336376 [Rhodocollybia butyracea]|uniref:Uncharacterized protein n=1 Tax=Rhodocollybia butyracea TaxID=206335 RepID=A0A9P5U173_9AGAR|nr:hypothetical protein BDP27DRAFT_1336376 [Rhodocollybia butyracea]